jgi:predicted alpha/beta-hydrolase family hydrolase
MTTTLLLAFVCGVIIGAVCMGFPLYAAYKAAEVERKHLANRVASMYAETRAARRVTTYTRSKQT